MPGKTPWRKHLTNFVERREERRSDGTPETASFHSRGYHRYFEGYTEVLRVQPDGRRKIERVYTGLYRRQELTGTRRVILRVGLVLLWLLSAGCFLLFASRDVGSNRVWYVTLAEAASAAALFWILCTLVNYLTAPANLTIHDFRTTSGSLKRSSLTAAIAIAIAAAATLLHCVLHLGENAAAELPGALMGAAAAALALLMRVIERRVPYREFRSSHDAPENGAEIT